MARQNVTVIGLQWGDEGKGKLVDWLAESCDYVARYCGGANAGHTVVVGKERYALHLIPCGVLHKGVMNVVGNGVAFDPAVAAKEMDELSARGVSVGPENLIISAAANVVMPWHKLHDSLSEKQLGDSRIGTTTRGIGPCYADKALRWPAVRVADLADADQLVGRIRQIAPAKNAIFAALYQAPPMDVSAIEAECVELGRRLSPMIGNTGAVLRRACQQGKRILFEGGQGSMLDVDHGTYPFVTSSSVSACGIPAGAGVPPSAVGQVVGVIKAYSTRVGGGPFPTEQNNPTGDRVRQRGREYGTTTGRPRRCGWFDAFAVRYTAALSGVSELSLSLLDVLGGFDKIQVCTGYKMDGRPVADYDAALLDKAVPVYETLAGWPDEISDCRSFGSLPPAAQVYVNRLEELVGRPVGLISVGPERSQTIRHHSGIEGLA
ncbi:MAG: adenylosuccinate synthase [Planctomycetes bacterium]|nr:adenylosuccinate synthase [Planctomycetota bacterium]